MIELLSMTKLIQCHEHRHAICESVFRFPRGIRDSLGLSVLEKRQEHIFGPDE